MEPRTTSALPPIARDHAPARRVAGPPPLPRRRPDVEIAAAVDERRSTQRAALSAEVTFESADNFYAGFTEDVSEGGIFLATYHLRPIGTEIELTVPLPSGHVVQTTGVVRWVRDLRDETPDAPPGMGIQFTLLERADRAAIQAFVAARAPLFYED